MSLLSRVALAIAFIIFIHCSIAAQSVSINTSGASADASAILDVSSSTKGMLIPRVSKTQRTGIAAPAIGLLVFQNSPDSIGFYYFSGLKWIWLTDAVNDITNWSINGNNNITSNNFLGTTNDSALKIRVRNVPSGMVDSISINTSLGYGTLRNVVYVGASQGRINTALGYRALDSNSTGNSNTGIGSYALLKNKIGVANTAVGTNAGTNLGSANNTAIGYAALGASASAGGNTATGAYASVSTTTGIGNVSNGYNAMYNNTSGSYNVAMGTGASNDNTIGSSITTIGFNAGFSNTGSYNTFLGAVSGAGAAGSSAGSENTGVGYNSLTSIQSGAQNTALGINALVLDTSGTNNVALGVNTLFKTTTNSNNTAVGSKAGDGFNNGDNNTFIGANSDANAAGHTNATAIGANAFVSQDNSLVLGSINGINGATASTAVGIGTSAPGATLDVKGNFSLGANGTAINEIIKQTATGTIPFLNANGTSNFFLTVPNAAVGSTVIVSPATVLATGTVIAYALVSTPGTVEVYVGNFSSSNSNSQNGINFYVTVIR